MPAFLVVGISKDENTATDGTIVVRYACKNGYSTSNRADADVYARCKTPEAAIERALADRRARGNQTDMWQWVAVVARKEAK